MAHDIWGTRAIFNKLPAWHLVGRVFTDVISSIAEAVQEVHAETLGVAAITGIDANGREYTTDEHKLIVRSDGKVLGPVGAGYELVDPITSMMPLQPFIDSGLCELEAMGCLDEGRKMWGLLRVKDGEREIVKGSGDVVKAYILASNGFCGNQSFTLGDTQVRVVCANTLAMAESGDASTLAKLRHTSSIHRRITDVQRTVAERLASFTKTLDAYQAIAKKRASAQELVSYVERVLIPEGTKPEDVSTRMQNKVMRVLDLLDQQEGAELVTVRGTYWQGYNAVTQYLTHEVGRTGESRLNSQWYGESAAMNQRALDLAITM